MCRVMQVSSSGYYYWLKHPIGKREIERSELSVKIKESYDESKGTYGSPRITKALQAGGTEVSRPRVARIMRGMGLRSIVRRKWRACTTDSDHRLAVCANLLDRDFHSDKLGEKWVGDLTYIPTDEGWLYLTTVMDLADRKIIGWAQSESMEAELTTIPALRMALANRRPVNGMVFHSDRGVQYACGAFREALRQTGIGIHQSMSRKGNCWDNAPMESFYKTLKAEEVNRHHFRTKQKAKLVIFEYIEGWYNRKRLHSTLGYITPCQAETILAEKAA